MFVVETDFYDSPISLQQWCAVTSETGHAAGMPKTGHTIMYYLGSLWVGHAIFSG